MDLENLAQYTPLWMAARHFGLSPSQLHDRIRYYNRRHLNYPIRREHGLVCVADLLLIFPSADPHEQLRRELHDSGNYP